MSFQQENLASNSPASGSWGYYSLSPSPTNFSDSVTSWNVDNKQALAKNKSVSTSTPGLAFASTAASAGSTVTYRRRRDNPGVSFTSTRCSSVSGGLYCLGEGNNGAKRRGGSQVTSPPASSSSSATLEESFDFSGKNMKDSSADGGRRRKKSDSSSTPESPSTIGAPLGPPRVRKNPFFRTMNMGASCGPNAARDAEEILKNSPDTRPKTGWTPYKALPAIGCSTNNFKQHQGERPETIVDCDFSRAGSPEMDDSMPFPDDIRNFGDEEDPDPDEEYLHQKRLNGDVPAREIFLVHVESNLVPDDLAVPDKPPLIRKRTFEIIEPVDDDLERPTVDDDCDLFSESEDEMGDSDDEEEEDVDGEEENDEDSDDCQLKVDLSDTDMVGNEEEDDEAVNEEPVDNQESPASPGRTDDTVQQPKSYDERPLFFS